MTLQIPDAGSANEELVGNNQRWWQEAAATAETDLSNFNSAGSLDERIAWAFEQGLGIGTVYGRFNSQRQHSTHDQVRTCVQHAAMKGIFCPPEFGCTDEAKRGYFLAQQSKKTLRGWIKVGLAGDLIVIRNRAPWVFCVRDTTGDERIEKPPHRKDGAVEHDEGQLMLTYVCEKTKRHEYDRP